MSNRPLAALQWAERLIDASLASTPDAAAAAALAAVPDLFSRPEVVETMIRVAQQQQLVWETGKARSPAEITRRATTQLHLVPLEEGAVTYAPSASQPAD